jgi:hypothetical protein
MNLPNIYTVLEQINLEKEAENIEKEILLIQNISDGDTKFNREQILFSTLQKFYEKVIELTEKSK